MPFVKNLAIALAALVVCAGLSVADPPHGEPDGIQSATAVEARSAVAGHDAQQNLKAVDQVSMMTKN